MDSSVKKASRRSAAAGRDKVAASNGMPRVRRGPKTHAGEAGEIRDRIYRAAANVVGGVGYAEASISLITREAGVAQGTFYRYFKSRQDLLDKLLPDMGEHLLADIRKAVEGVKGFPAIEEGALQAFFAFLRKFPPFFRILNEAESFAPKGYRQHFATVSKGYVKFLKRSLADGRFPNFAEDELETIAYLLMAARNYLSVLYVGTGGTGRVPQRVVDTYMKFILYGLEGVPARAAKPGRKRKGRAEAAPR